MTMSVGAKTWQVAPLASWVPRSRGFAVALALAMAALSSASVLRPDRSAVTAVPSERVRVRVSVSSVYDAAVTVVPVTPVNAVEIAVETSSVVVSPERSAVTGSPSDKVRVRSSLSAAYDALVIVASVWAARALVIAAVTSSVVESPVRLAVTGPPSDNVSVRVSESVANDAPVSTASVSAAIAVLIAVATSELVVRRTGLR